MFKSIVILKSLSYIRRLTNLRVRPNLNTDTPQASQLAGVIMKNVIVSFLLGFSLIAAACAQEAAPVAQEPPAQPAAAEPAVQPAATEAAAPAPQGPRIACDEPIYNFGAVETQDDIEHTFTIRNTGDTTLVISSVRASCGCTVAQMSEEDKTIPPGEDSPLTARLSLKGRTGQQSKSISIMSNDPNQPQFQVSMVGSVNMAMQLVPNRLMFNQISPGQTLEQTAELINASSSPVTVTKIETSDPSITATPEVVEEGRRVRILVKMTGPVSYGPVNAALRVHTDNPARPMLELPVGGNVVGEIVYAPTELVIPADAGGQPVTKNLIVRKGSIPQFEIKEVIPPNPDIKTTVTSFADQGYRIMIENIVPSDDLDGKALKVVTTSEQMSEISIPFRIQR
jgi:hypothetical protein